MDENSLLIPVAMKIIMNSGNARTKANEALEALSIFDFSNAHKKISISNIWFFRSSTA